MNNRKNILITGGSGLIGARLTELLLQRGDKVRHLGRSKSNSNVPTFLWDIPSQSFDEQAIRNVDTIIHLAGAGIADKRWTEKRKLEILESRTKSTQILFDALSRNAHEVKTFISASAVGYYGFDRAGQTFTEASPPGSDFLAEVTRKWENEADRISALGIRVVKLRTGIVLSKNGGALEKMSKPVKWFAGAPLGTGAQYISWIHIDDLCSLYMKSIDDPSVQGAYNAAAPHPVTNKEMTKAIAQVLKKPMFLPNVPPVVLKIILGEMSDAVLNGNKISADKILKTGYTFQFKTLDSALADLL
jgi:uncharacterized protein (TIGR01777 family)